MTAPIWIAMPSPEPLDIVLDAWNERWTAPMLAQCFYDMPLDVAQQLLDAQSLDEARTILNLERPA